VTVVAAMHRADPAPSSSGANLHRFARAARDHSVLLALGIVVLAPFAWMLSTSIKPADEIFGEPLNLIPGTFDGVRHYTHAFTSVPLLRFIVNGVVVVLGILLVQVSVATLCAYALAKLEFRGRGLLFALVILALCIPIQVPALPLYIALAKLGALDTYFALMVPFFLSVFAIFLFRQFFKGFPDEIIQAARLDGFTEIEILARLIVPSARPAIAAFSVFSITAHWNDLYWPLIAIRSLDRATPPLGMLLFNEAEMGANFGALSAGAVIVTAPLLIVFLFAQRQFIRGITLTGFR
jgi:multiple sugar transport system permease protein